MTTPQAQKKSRPTKRPLDAMPDMDSPTYCEMDMVRWTFKQGLVDRPPESHKDLVCMYRYQATAGKRNEDLKFHVEVLREFAIRYENIVKEGRLELALTLSGFDGVEPYGLNDPTGTRQIEHAIDEQFEAAWFHHRQWMALHYLQHVGSDPRHMQRHITKGPFHMTLAERQEMYSPVVNDVNVHGWKGDN